MGIRSEHLSEEELALYVEGMKLDVSRRLPERLLAHVEGCLNCKVELMELFELVDALDERVPYLTLKGHPFFG